MANYILTKHPGLFDKVIPRKMIKDKTYAFSSLEKLAALGQEIAFDSETTGLFALQDDMFCVQIGDRNNNYLVVLYDNDDEKEHYTFYDVIPYLENKTLVLQNALFDLGFMYKYRFIPEKIFDTMLATRVLYNGDFENRMSDFGSIMERELGIKYDKSSQENINTIRLSKLKYIEYCFNDVDRLQDAHDVLYQKLEANDQLETYLLQCRFIKALAYMEQCGLPINKQSWKDKMNVDEKMLKESEQIVHEFIYDELPQYGDNQIDMFEEFVKRTVVNLQSPKQMIKIFKGLGINVLDKDKKESINENIISKSKHPFVKIWLNYQGYQHRVSTFGKSIYDKIIDGRVYTNFNPLVDTGRLASRKGSINFLNFPSDKATRNCFEAPPGNKMIVCDYSGQETVISADISGDEAMTKSVVEGADLHCLLAREIYPELKELSDDEIKEKHSDKRTKSKAPRFAINQNNLYIAA